MTIHHDILGFCCHNFVNQQTTMAKDQEIHSLSWSAKNRLAKVQPTDCQWHTTFQNKGLNVCKDVLALNRIYFELILT